MSKVIEKKKVLSQDDKLKLVNAYADKHNITNQQAAITIAQQIIDKRKAEN